MGQWCCVKGCRAKSHDKHGRKVGHEIRFFRFPTWKRGFGQQAEEITKRRRMAWVAAVRRMDITFNNISPFLRVCSRHFHKGQPAYEMMEADPDWAPSLQLGHTAVKPTNAARSARRSRWDQLRKDRLQAAEMRVNQDADADPGELQTKEGTSDAGEESGQLQTREETHRPGRERDQLITEDVTQTECNLCVLRRSEVNRLLEENRELQCELNVRRMSEGFFGEDDEKVKYYTGLPNLGTFMALFNFLLPLMPSKKKILTPFQMLLLTFMRLRLDLPPQHLAHLFHVSPKTVYRTFDEMVSVLHANLRHSIVWPDKNTLNCIKQKYKILTGTIPINTVLPCDREEGTMLDKVVTVCCALTNRCLDSSLPLFRT
ncbi:uncharacterized protein LOC121649569 [Melanotaenia boesemani]|uniref:uncharacterized protein LOC121649569 n=1 Tax=Melanotaenia boesemani TaxID=1250792 RepID=UPI001C048122|nr:uncharacterized protein LOC121649569 [Melanotaenia boesemani]